MCEVGAGVEPVVTRVNSSEGGKRGVPTRDTGYAIWDTGYGIEKEGNTMREGDMSETMCDMTQDVMQFDVK